MARAIDDLEPAAVSRRRCWGLFDWFCRVWQVIARRPKGRDPCVYVPGRLAATDYDLAVTVRNSSRSRPAPGTQVSIRWIEFGAGSQVKHPITALSTDVPVWPGTAVVNTTWTTPATLGHFCIEVELAHPDDGNPANNRGWNNIQVHAANSSVERPIRIFNQFPRGCPQVVEGGGPRLRPRRAILGWGAPRTPGSRRSTTMTGPSTSAAMRSPSKDRRVWV